jgi:signal transduction histidine kinase
MTAAGRAEERLLVLAPTGRDAALCRDVLADAGVACVLCPDLPAVCRELADGAGALLLPEEALTGDGAAGLATVLAAQPPWSDLPVLVLTRGGADSPLAAQALAALGNVMLVERPVRVAALVSAVRVALRARRRQYQIREHLAEQAEADRRKDEFLAMLAHELRNPLAPLATTLHVLRRTAGLHADVTDAHALMDRQVRQMARLLDDLLDVSRITRGQVTLRLEPVDLANVIAGAVDTCRPLIDARGHTLTVGLPDEPVRLRADGARLTQVLANLLVNAAKYTEPGGQIGLSAAQDGGEVVIRVRDNGPGIAPDMLPRVFDLFAQADRTLDRSQGGLGIGLTLVKRLVELHGGLVEARSGGLGTGSEFVVRLPALAVAAVPPPPPPNGHPVPSGPRRVLVVEDNPDAARSLATLLRLEGHDVRLASDGPQALAAAAESRPDVVLCDLGLPGMDGYAVAAALRAGPATAGVRLVALTGYGQDADRRRSAAAGFDLHLTKPVDPAALHELLAGGLSTGHDG